MLHEKPNGCRNFGDIFCPSSRPLDEDQVYTIVVTNYLAGGGDGFISVADNTIKHLQGPLDTDVLKEYIKVCVCVSMAYADEPSGQSSALKNLRFVEA